MWLLCPRYPSRLWNFAWISGPHICWERRLSVFLFFFSLSGLESWVSNPPLLAPFTFDFPCSALSFFFSRVRMLSNAHQVKIVPRDSILPQAARALVLAARSGFRLERAKASYQETHYRRSVPWSDGLIDELGRGLIVCRIV